MTRLTFDDRPAVPLPPAAVTAKSVLNIGSGPATSTRLHQGFKNERWREIRLDVDPRVGPDFVGSVVDMKALVEDASIDAVWCSHILEHLFAHEVVPGLTECRRVLKPDGFALITSPDLMAIARMVVDQGLEARAYVSPAGPITPLDMLFGHGASIQAGSHFMAHRTGFTADLLGRLATAAGFHEARVITGDAFDLWAVLLMPQADLTALADMFRGTEVATLFA